MNLWRLELLRLTRTYRWMILFGVYGFFGVLGPVTAAYLDEILGRLGGGVVMVVPDPRPVDGIVQFISNASQLGLLGVVIVAAAALAVDARPEVAAFLRTRVRRASALVVPRYVVVTMASVAALVVGTALAWGMTVVLIGALPAGLVAIGTIYGALYLAFVVAVVAAVAGLARSLTGTVFASLAVLLTLPILGLASAVKPWLPSELLAAVAAVIEGVPAGDFARAVGVSLVASALLLAFAVHRSERRET